MFIMVHCGMAFSAMVVTIMFHSLLSDSDDNFRYFDQPDLTRKTIDRRKKLKKKKMYYLETLRNNTLPLKSLE